MNLLGLWFRLLYLHIQGAHVEVVATIRIGLMFILPITHFNIELVAAPTINMSMHLVLLSFSVFILGLFMI